MLTTVNNGVTPNVSSVGQSADVDGTPSAAVSAGLSGSAASLSALLLDTTPTADAGASGLRSPVNPENGEALLLLVESQADQASAATRGASLASRFGAAQNAIGASAAALSGAVDGVKGAESKLATSQAKLAGDTAAGASSDVLKADQDEVDAAQTALTTAQATLSTLNLATDASAAVSIVTKGLRADVAQDDARASGGSARREIAYEDVAGTAKRFRDDEVDRARQDGAQRARGGESRDEDRGVKLAQAVAAGMIDAMATIQGVLASRPPLCRRPPRWSPAGGSACPCRRAWSGRVQP